MPDHLRLPMGNAIEMNENPTASLGRLSVSKTEIASRI